MKVARRSLVVTAITGALFLLFSSVAGAQEAAADNEFSANSMKYLAAALAMGIGSIAPAIGIGMIGSSAMQAVGRNPEAAGSVQTPMILTVAFAEAIGIYALVVAILIGFVF
jgi:F-type H+-transporting ATPase subunit c